MGAPIDLSGERFDRLFVVMRANDRKLNDGTSRRAWLCKCDCGNEVIVTTAELRSGDTKSCGCLKRELDCERATTHGYHGTHIHNVWCAMRRRCRNSTGKSAKYYHDRGISVCPEWDNDFLNFYEWSLSNGYSEGLTIDRIDVNGGYEPGNCRWVSMKTQANNRSNSRNISFRGEMHTLQEWSEICGIPYTTLYMRFRNGWSTERAFTQNNTV